MHLRLVAVAASMSQDHQGIIVNILKHFQAKDLSGMHFSAIKSAMLEYRQTMLSK
jgi:DNA polymerase III psi subunit